MKIYFAMKINQVVYKDLQKFMCYDNHVLLMVSSTSNVNVYLHYNAIVRCRSC